MRVVVVYREVTEHRFIAEVDTTSFDEAQQRIRNMNEQELESVSQCNWLHDEFHETVCYRMKGEQPK